jgi:hypothetical protein
LRDGYAPGALFDVGASTRAHQSATVDLSLRRDRAAFILLTPDRPSKTLDSRQNADGL